jgi:pilus assembly protein CpaF
MKADGTIQGHYTPTGYVPKCLEKLKIFGISIPEASFIPVFEGVNQ